MFKYRNYRTGLGFGENSGGRVDRNKAASAASSSSSFHQMGLGSGSTDVPVAAVAVTLITSSGLCLFLLQGVSGGLQC